jgi:hypothetical protein
MEAAGTPIVEHGVIPSDDEDTEAGASA